MKRDGETGSIERVAGVPHPEGAADSEAHREDPTKTDEHAGADPAAGIKHVDPMVLWGHLAWRRTNRGTAGDAGRAGSACPTWGCGHR